jgi:hypothetical protein
MELVDIAAASENCKALLENFRDKKRTDISHPTSRYS